jgi:hypothetical protein
MKIPFKPSLMKIRRQSVKWIILHHTAEMYDIPSARIDNSKFQIQDLASGVLEKKQADINYHYVVDKIKEDYMPIACRPISYLCEWEDIDLNMNNRAIHIALMGSYDFKIPEPRCYQILAYKLLTPMLKLFKIPPSKIKLHRDVSSIKDLTCPGDFIDEAIVIANVRRFVIK